MSIIVYLESCRNALGDTVHVCTDAKVECSPRDGFNNKKLLAFEHDLREFVNNGLAEARESEGTK